MVKILRQAIKKTVRIIWITAVVPVVLILLAYLLLWLPPVQRKVKDIALQEVMKKTHNRISIGDIQFRPFSRLQLKEVYAAGQQGDTLLYAARLSAGFDLFKLFDNHLFIRSVELENFKIHIQKDSLNADFNFQFLIDAFASGQTATVSTSQISIQIRDICLKNGRLRYDVLSCPVLADSLLDYNHIDLALLRSDISLEIAETGNMDIRMKQLSFLEKSGLNIKQLQAHFTSNGEKYSLEDLHLKLPHSQIHIVDAYYTPPRPLKGEPSAHNPQTATPPSGGWGVTLKKNAIHLPDLKMLYPGFKDLPENLTLSAEINGTLPQINIARFQAGYGKHIHLNLQGSIADYNRWQNTPVRLELKELSADAYGLEEILHLLSENPEQKLPVKPGAIRLQGSLSGALPRLSLRLTAGSDCGNIRLEGAGGYDFTSQETRFDVSLQSEQFDVATLLQDTLYGLAGLQVQAKGKIAASGQMNINGNARIDRFDFMNYAYNHIWANAMYRGDSILLNVYSDDNNFPLEINACAHTGKKTQALQVDANLECIYLDALGFLPDFKQAFLIGRIRADVNGFDPEKMQAVLSIDSLTFITHKGTFNEPHLHLAYSAKDKNDKHLQITSSVVNARADGNFTYTGLLESLQETFPMLFPPSKVRPKKKDSQGENLDFRLGMNNLHSIAGLLELPQSLPDSALVIGKYKHEGQDMKLSASAYTRFSEADTLQVSLSLANKAGHLAAIVNVDNKSANYDFDGSIDAEVEFIPENGSRMPGMNITLHPTVWVLNETDFDFNPAQIEIRENWYNIRDLSLDYAGNPNEYIRVNGAISASPDDSLTLDVSQFQLSTLFGAVKTDIPLTGAIEGKITARELLATPVILSRDFAVNSITYAGNPVGDLHLSSGWSRRYNGLALHATLGREDRPPSAITGIFLPEQDSLAIEANIRDIELQWFEEMMQGTLYGLAGSIGADLTIGGKIQNPVVRGAILFNDAQVGINSLQTRYSIQDTMYIEPDAIELKKFIIRDENKHTLSATGKITHDYFSNFNPAIYLSLSDFQVINNVHQTDSLFYGNLRINGLLNVKKSKRDWVISGDITHSDKTKITVNIPSTASTAERYSLIHYIQTENEEIRDTKIQKKPAENFSLPLKINTTLWFDPSLTIGAVFNPVTGDAAFVKGNGMLKFGYDMTTSALSLAGDYEIASGNVSLSLANITRKTFTVQEGGTLTFHGDPMATSFSLTAVYNLRADLKTLDTSFENIGMATTRVPVSCSLTATGKIDKMALEYDLLLPNETDDIQRKVDGLLYTDDMKIKEIAYLMAFGSFLPASSNAPALGSPMLMNSLAALTSGGLNKLLSGVLRNNWAIGTDLQTGDNGFNNMAINVSGSLLNDRLTINGSVGYHNNATQTNNFTGDFDVEYKLVSSGNVALKIYNATNNQYYEQATTTQGAGVVYKRSARTFRKLFDKFGKKK